jgi:hypothetical protein
MNAQHTPWRTVTTNYAQNMGVNMPVRIVDARDNHVATCGWPGAPKHEDVLNALAIVDAVNAKAAGSAA